jgi:hypothetical protein
MPTTFEQRLPVTVSLIVIEYLPVNSQFVDEALRFPWLAKGGPGNANSTSHRWPNPVVVPLMPKRPEPANVTASVGVQENVAGGTAGARWPLVPPPLGETTAMFKGAEPKMIVPPVNSSVKGCEKAGTEAKNTIVNASRDLIAVSIVAAA